MTAKPFTNFSTARPIAKNLEWLAVRGGVEIFYNPQKEWFTVKTSDGTTVSNIDLREALDVARDLFEEIDMTAKYRVWNFVNMHGPEHYPVKSPEHGARLINALAESQLLDRQITDNAFGLEVFEDGEWTEWMDEDGNDVDYLCDEMQEK